MNSCQGWRSFPYSLSGLIGSSELKKTQQRSRTKKRHPKKPCPVLVRKMVTRYQLHKLKDWWCYTFTLKETDVINFQVNDSRFFFGLSPPMNSPPFKVSSPKISMSSATHRRAMIAYMAGVMFFFPWIPDPTEQWKKGPWLVGLNRGWSPTQLYRGL